MQRYYITDGERYIRKVHTKYVTASCATMADTFTLKQAQNILEHKLCKAWQKSFHYEGVDDFSIVNPELDRKDAACKCEGDVFSFDTSVLENIEKCVNDVLSISLPSKEHLLRLKRDLEDAQQFYDRACTDITHWVREHKPPAHIETQAYGLQHKFEVERARIKENYGFVITLIQAEEKSYTYSQLAKSLRERVYTPYTPNTYVYGLLDKLIS